MLMRPQRPSVLAQVERIEGVALGGEALGHVSLEEVIAVPVHIEDRAALGASGGKAHERCYYGAVVVGRELELEGLVAREQAVRLPALHGARVPTRHVP